MSARLASRGFDICDLTPPFVQGIAPYIPGKPIPELARELGLDPQNIVKLASNENPLGTSPLAMQAIERSLPEIARYPDGNGFELKQALARRYQGIEVNRIVLGNGSNDVLDLAARAFLTGGSEAIYSQHAFAVYKIATQAVGATGIEVRARNYAHDLEAMLRAVTAHTRLIFIANPNNPTGTYLGEAELLKFLRALPAAAIVVLDEAYNEYLPLNLAVDSLSWLHEFSNLIITRTFSKAYGLAGLRVGYAFAHPDVADMMNRVRQPFNVNSIALAAAAAALSDVEFVRRSFDVNQAGMQQITEGLKQLGLDFIASAGNFLSLAVADAAGVFDRLLHQGVIVRPIANYGMPNHLRVSVGLESENRRFLEALEGCLLP